jgi:hypothetical protein
MGDPAAITLAGPSDFTDKTGAAELDARRI